ncbi:MAG: NUDIX domain-containing protein [Phycisphaerae bacterium]|nr:NUDIX domain-containing protein [Phycisphaerae bacterium]
MRRKRKLYVAGIIERSDNVILIQVSPETGDGERRWQFPRGAAREDESPEGAMRRVGRSAAGAPVEIVVGQPPLLAQIDGEEVELRYFFCGVALSETRELDEARWRWIRKGHLREYDFDDPSKEVAEWLLEQG